MKRNLISLLGAALLAFTIAIPCCFTGCKTGGAPTTREAAVFYSFRSVYDAAFEGYKQAHKLDLQGKVTAGRMVEVNRKWNQFRQAHKLAFAAAALNWDATAPAEVLKLRDELLTLIRNL